MIAGERILVVLLLLGFGAGTAIGESCVHCGGHIQLGTCFLGGESQRFLGELNYHVLLGKCICCSTLHGGDRLTAGHTANIDTGYHYIVQDPVAVGIVRGSPHAEKDYQYNADKQYGSGSAQANKNPLAVIVHEAHKTLGKGDGFVFSLVVPFFRLLGDAWYIGMAGGTDFLIINRGNGGRKVRGRICGSFFLRREMVLFRRVIQI